MIQSRALYDGYRVVEKSKKSCNLQKLLDDSTIVGFIGKGKEAKYRGKLYLVKAENSLHTFPSKEWMWTLCRNVLTQLSLTSDGWSRLFNVTGVDAAQTAVHHGPQLSPSPQCVDHNEDCYKDEES